MTAWIYAHTTAQQEARRQGADTLLIRDSHTGAQRFYSRNRGNDVEIEVTNIAPYAITWGDVERVVSDLVAVCWDSLCDFEFDAGPNRISIGRGRVAVGRY